VRVWSVPAFDKVDVELKTPNFGGSNEAPF